MALDNRTEILTTDAQIEIIAKAAGLAGQKLGPWIRAAALKQARADLKEAGE